MIILKILNNNVAIASLEGKEIVVMGKGLVFQKKVGDYLDTSKIEKSFSEVGLGFFEKFSELATEIQPLHLEIVSEIVDLATTILNTKLNDNIYITLVDHINFAITRFESSYEVKNALLWETKKFYPKEYEIGLKALDIIFQKTKIKMNEDEAGFIALHIVNAEQSGLSVHITQEALKMIQDILTIITYNYGIVLDENSLSYTRLVTHLQFFARRILQNEKVEYDDDSLYEQIKVKYPNANKCVLKISAYLEKNYQIKITDEELVYLILHVHRTTKK